MKLLVITGSLQFYCFFIHPTYLKDAMPTTIRNKPLFFFVHTTMHVLQDISCAALWVC